MPSRVPTLDELIVTVDYDTHNWTHVEAARQPPFRAFHARWPRAGSTTRHLATPPTASDAAPPIAQWAQGPLSHKPHKNHHTGPDRSRRHGCGTGGSPVAFEARGCLSGISVGTSSSSLGYTGFPAGWGAVLAASLDLLRGRAGDGLMGF